MFASIEFIKTKVFSACYLITQENYLNKSDTDVEFDIRLIASPIKLDIGKTSIFFVFLTFSWLSIEVSRYGNPKYQNPVKGI